ncbi:MAG: multicopper oxidase domain-containing protein, partial [Synechocystis sp.]|nr:multicopper oxidase domain-containing protein [Synechocystis sp.]
MVPPALSHINRRQFLRFSTGIGAAMILDQFRPAYGQTDGGKVLTYPDEVTLHIQETPFMVGSRQGTAVTVNGSVPAPLLRFKEGQTVKLKVVNHLKEDTSIHWHGIILPFDMDGVPGVSFAGIRPGETFTYQFPLNQNGTYWYHSHSGMQEQRGHYGAFIVDPKDPDFVEFDRDYAIILSDWTFEDPHAIMRNLKRMPTFYNNQRRTVAHLAEDWDWKGMRMDPVDIADVTGATYTYLLNGQAPAKNWTGLFSPGEKVRLRFINGSAMTFFDVRIPGLKMTVVQADGQNVEPVTVDEFRIG